jgi:hypothetical protein
VAVLIVLGMSSSVAYGRAQPRVVGGPVVASPQDAPWSVLLEMSSGSFGASCTGSIIDASHVVTAAHCTYDDAQQALPASAYTVTAGIVDATSSGDTSKQQQSAVSSVRVHPGYVPSQTSYPDDVAVLTLATPFTTTAAVAPIGVVGLNAEPAVGSTARSFGWGVTTPPAQNDGHEHYLDQTFTRAYRCAPGLAGILCASSSSGTLCHGDSGGGMVLLGGTPKLVAVEDFGGTNCNAGDTAGLADLAAPEIGSWVAGNASPPQGPRTTAPATLGGEGNAGGTATCAAPPWSNAPSLSYDFIDPDSGRVLQHGPATYVLAGSDVGHRVACVSIAANGGGTAEIASSMAVTVAPPVDPGLTLSIAPNGTFVVGKGAPVPLSLHLVFTNARGVVAAVLSFLSTQPVPAPPALPGGIYRVCLQSDPSGIYGAGSACATWVKAGRASSLITRGPRKRHGGRWTVTLHVASAEVGKKAKLTWKVRRCATCSGTRQTHRTIKLRRTVTLHSPNVPRGRSLVLVLHVPRATAAGLPYKAADYVLTVGRRPKHG